MPAPTMLPVGRGGLGFCVWPILSANFTISRRTAGRQAGSGGGRAHGVVDLRSRCFQNARAVEGSLLPRWVAPAKHGRNNKSVAKVTTID